MDKHVDVLRVLRDFYAGSVLNHAEKAAALDHAIATCEQHAALVARLGECLRLHGKWCETGSRTDKAVFVNEADQLFINHADDLARVVKENGDG